MPSVFAAVTFWNAVVTESRTLAVSPLAVPDGTAPTMSSPTLSPGLRVNDVTSEATVIPARPIDENA